MLADRSIRRLIVQQSKPMFEPELEDVQYQPASVDLRLGDGFKVLRQDRRLNHWLLPHSEHRRLYIDTRTPTPEDWFETLTVDGEGEYVIEPNTFTLATTLERVNMPSKYVARVEGKSSIGRMGLIIHATAGFIDPGFEGQITLEMMNLSSRPIVLHLGMKICQLSFSELDCEPIRAYGHPELKSRYQGQTGVTASRVHEKEEPHGE